MISIKSNNISLNYHIGVTNYKNGFLNLVVMIQEDYEKTFGDYIKFLRGKYHLTQIDLAVKVNNSYQNISSLERN